MQLYFQPKEARSASLVLGRKLDKPVARMSGREILDQTRNGPAFRFAPCGRLTARGADERSAIRHFLFDNPQPNG
jgi:hypothetical protein